MKTETKTKLTRERLERFVKIRNKAEFHSNLQFQSDANACGFSVHDLGDVEKVVDTNVRQYVWQTPVGTLIEENGLLRIG